jgi:hypothetical protein
MYVGMGAPPPLHHPHGGGSWGPAWGGYGGGWGRGFTEIVEIPVQTEQTASEWITANAPLAMGLAFLAGVLLFRGRN